MNLGLDGARILVTAASQGLGAAVARQFSREGAVVAINSRSATRLDATASSIRAETGGVLYTIPADLSVPSQAADVVAQAAAVMGGLDVLVTNAGGPATGTLEAMRLEEWQQAIDALLLSVIAMVGAALPHLRASSRASVLTITSVSAKQPIEGLPLSNVLRPAVVAYTRTLANELGPEGVRANSILPGMTDTERVDELMRARAARSGRTPEDERARAASEIPLRRIGTPEEFANAAVFLCSPAAGSIHGVALAVDGGSTRGLF